MATSTTNLGLIKPAGTDKIRIAQINQNMDTLDAAVGAVGATSLQAQVNALGDGLAIVANGDSHIAISAGQYVYVKNNTHSLNEGLYVASAAVSANGAITSSNMTADDDGGLNALSSNKTDKAHFTQATYNYRSYSTWQEAMVANKSTLLPENGTYTFGFLTDGGAPHVFTLIKDGNYINGTHQVYNGYEEAVYSTDGGSNWTVQSLNAKIPNLNIAYYSNGNTATQKEFDTKYYPMYFVTQIYRNTGEDNRDGYGIIKIYNNTPYLVKVTGMTGFSVDSYDPTTGKLKFSHPAYSNVMISGYTPL